MYAAVPTNWTAWLFYTLINRLEYWFDQAEPLGAIFDRLGCSPGLRAVFGLPSVLIGVPPAVCPQFYHTMTLASYLLSAWRLEGHGSDSGRGLLPTPEIPGRQTCVPERR